MKERIIYQVWWDEEKDQQTSDIETFDTLEKAKEFCEEIEKKVARLQILASKEVLEGASKRFGDWSVVATKTYDRVDDDPSGWYEYDWVREELD